MQLWTAVALTALALVMAGWLLVAVWVAVLAARIGREVAASLREVTPALVRALQRLEGASQRADNLLGDARARWDRVDRILGTLEGTADALRVLVRLVGRRLVPSLLALAGLLRGLAVLLAPEASREAEEQRKGGSSA